MNFLLTGVNPVQCGHRPRLDYASAIQVLAASLSSAGHSVDLRPVTLGENLDRYDKVIVFLAGMRGFICQHTLSALWAIHAAGNKCAISFDDWQVRQAMAACRSFRAESDKILATNPFGYKQIENHAPYKTQLLEALDRVCASSWSWPVLVPAYVGGDLTIFQIPESRITAYNPSIVLKGKYGWNESVTAKKKEWVLAALHDHTKWAAKQGGTWTVNHYGHRSSGQERLVESKIYEKYVESWGVMAPGYKIAGSGWWRARYGFAADALSIIVGDPKEAAMIHSDAYILSAAEVSSLTDSELHEMALYQRDAYYTAAGTAKDLQERILSGIELN